MAKPIKPVTPVRHSLMFRTSCPVARRTPIRYLRFDHAGYADPVTCPDCKAAMVEHALFTDRDEQPGLNIVVGYDPAIDFES